MVHDIPKLPPEKILQSLARVFSVDAYDRHVYCVFGPYATLRPFQQRFCEQVEQGNFNSLGRVEYLSLNRAIVQHLRTRKMYDLAAQLAQDHREEEFRRILSETFRDLITRRIEIPETVGLVLADFELLYAYDLGNHEVPLTRLVAINGKRVSTCFASRNKASSGSVTADGAIGSIGLRSAPSTSSRTRCGALSAWSCRGRSKTGKGSAPTWK
jgi:hypothetical protein